MANPSPEPAVTASGMQLPSTTRTETVGEREAAGRAARGARQRTSLAEFSVAPDRPYPVQILADQEVSRVQPLLPLRHSRMSASPFAFYRGSAAVMAYDLGTMPSTGLITQLCGDAHLANFGLFAAPDRSLVFDINDFDETHPGPFEWDVQRLAVSFVLAGRDNRLGATAVSGAATAVGRAYREQMASYAGMRELDIWYDRVSVEVMQEWARQEGFADRTKQMAKSVAKARTRTAWSAIEKLTEVVDGERRFLDLPPLLMPYRGGGDVAERIHDLVRQYSESLPHDRQQLLRKYHAIDVAHKVVGVGSVGMLSFVILMQGRDENDLMVLQAKQAVDSVLEPYTGSGAYALKGERVVAGQQLMQAASDIFLGWVRGMATRDFYIRQLRDMKFAPDPSTLTAETLTGFAMLCGRTLARAHARAGDAVAIAAYLGTSDKFDRAITAFAHAYAAQVEVDYAAYEAAIADGRVGLGDNAEEKTYSLSFDPATGVEVTVGAVTAAPAESTATGSAPEVADPGPASS
jgi:uncharacterized protein (DUF2252 family)